MKIFRHKALKRFKLTAILVFTFLTSACSYGYDIVIINDSDTPIEVRYRTNTNYPFDDPMTKSVDDINAEKTLRRFWTKTTAWQKFPENQVETILAERIIKILPKEAVQIERGNYNPIQEERGDLTRIVDLRIISSHGEISYKGKLILDEFEKVDYTFIKIHRDGIKKEN